MPIGNIDMLSEVPEAPDVELVETDGEPMESDWHRMAMNGLIDAVKYRLQARNDFYVGGNMFIYFSLTQARNRDFRGPDFFFVDGVNREPIRPYWAVWLEDGRYPDVIIELLSPNTAVEDRTTKKAVYERVFHTPEYYCYDHATQQLEGWRLDRGHYQPLTPDTRGWLWCERLGLWLGTWAGTCFGSEAIWLRFYDPDGHVVPLPDEAERQRAEAERQRAEAERQRAESLEAEVARLRARLAQFEGTPPTSC